MPGTFDKKLLALSAASALTGSESLYCVQAGLDKRTSPAQLATYLGLGVVDETVISLLDAATVAMNVSLGNMFQLLANGDRTMSVPTGAPGVGRSQKIVIRHKAVGANRTLTLTTGVAGGFRHGAAIPILTATLSGLTDYIGCIWNQPDSRWDVVSYSKGF